MKKEAGRRTVIRVMAVLFVGIMAGTVAASGVSRGEETEMALCYENLENLVKESCPQVEMERRQFEERLGRLEDAREELLESRRALLNPHSRSVRREMPQDGWNCAGWRIPCSGR